LVNKEFHKTLFAESNVKHFFANAMTKSLPPKSAENTLRAQPRGAELVFNLFRRFSVTSVIFGGRKAFS
jgi:hypothetical protein